MSPYLGFPAHVKARGTRPSPAPQIRWHLIITHSFIAWTSVIQREDDSGCYLITLTQEQTSRRLWTPKAPLTLDTLARSTSSSISTQTPCILSLLSLVCFMQLSTYSATKLVGGPFPTLSCTRSLSSSSAPLLLSLVRPATTCRGVRCMYWKFRSI